jgi:hypothetical protein
MTWILSFSFDVSMKNTSLFFLIVLLGFTFKCRSGNPDLVRSVDWMQLWFL